MAHLREHLPGPVPDCIAGVDAVLNELNWTIDNLVKRRDLLKHHRERLARPPPVCFLPEDILISIFQMCITSPFSSYTSALFPWASNPSRGLRYFQSFSFSRVCCTWRYLALNTPILWKDTILTHPAITSVMLERAKDIPIRVFVDFCSDGFMDDVHYNPEAINRVLRKTSQISDLAILGSEDSAASILGILSTLNQLGPCCLQTLNVTMPDESSLSLGPSHMDHLTMLSELSLLRCSPPWDSPTLGRLTRLHLSGEWASGGCDYPLDSLIQTLGHSPSLADVRLDYCIQDEPFPSSLGIPVRLPKLRSLTLNDDLRICLTILESIEACPSLMHLSISDACYGTPRSDFMRALFPEIRRLYARSNTSPHSFVSLDISARSLQDDQILIRGSWTQPSSTRPSCGSFASTDGFYFRLEEPSFEEARVAVDLAVTNLPMTRICSIHGTAADTWRSQHVFALTSLTRIVVGDLACMQFINNWCAPAHAAGAPVTQFPALERLSFRICDFSLRHEQTALTLSPLTDTRSELRSLLDTVRQCWAHGRELKQLTFTSCYFENDYDEYHAITDKGFIRTCFEPYVDLVEIDGIRSRPLM
jgi:hypothetical protein